MDNSTTFDYQLSQFGSWYLLAGIECYLETADAACECDALLRELDRVESWERDNGGYYHQEYTRMRFDSLRDRIAERKADIEAFESHYWAERARSEFTVIEGGLSGNNSQ